MILNGDRIRFRRNSAIFCAKLCAKIKCSTSRRYRDIMPECATRGMTTPCKRAQTGSRKTANQKAKDGKSEGERRHNAKRNV